MRMVSQTEGRPRSQAQRGHSLIVCLCAVSVRSQRRGMFVRSAHT